MSKKFYLPKYEDKRFEYTKEFLISKDLLETNSEFDADLIILPLPTKMKHIKQFNYENLKNKYIFLGKPNEDVCLALKDVDYYDYFTDESYVLKNAFATSEGAVALLKENYKRTIYNSNILISGFGRIGKSLALVLLAMGAKLTVLARSEVAENKARLLGADFLYFNKHLNKKETLEKFDVIFNTVPHLVFTKNEIFNINEKTLFIDLASFPGGIDLHCAESQDIKVINGNFLPKKYSEESAGIFIGESIIKKLEEGI